MVPVLRGRGERRERNRYLNVKAILKYASKRGKKYPNECIPMKWLGADKLH